MADAKKGGWSSTSIIVFVIVSFVLVCIFMHCHGTTGTYSNYDTSVGTTSFTVNGITYKGTLLARQNASGNLNYADFVVQPHDQYTVSQYNMDTRNAIYNIVDYIGCTKSVGQGYIENPTENSIHIFVLDSGTEIVALKY